MWVRLLIFFLVLGSMFYLPNLALVQQWDQAAMAFVAAHRSPGLTIFFKWMTDMGGTAGFLFVFLGLTLYLLLKKKIRPALYFFIGVGLLKLSGVFLKIWVARPRPPKGLYELSTFSMPSGHAINATLIFGALVVLVASQVSQALLRVILSILCLTAAFAVGLSRVYLGVHYPSDVLVGMLYAASGLWLLLGFSPGYGAPARP